MKLSNSADKAIIKAKPDSFVIKAKSDSFVIKLNLINLLIHQP